MVRHIRKFIISIISTIMFLIIFTNFFSIETCSASSTIHVYSGESIQDAIDAANESDTVEVHSGTYNENLVIDKTLTLTASGSVTIIGNADHTIKNINNSVQISGFTIKNIGESFGCIFLSSVTNCLITNNVIKNGGNGIYLGSSNSNTIMDNTIESNNIGIYLFSSDSNTIKSNNIQKNNANGIWLTSACNSNTIYLNDFSDNIDGNARDQGSNNWDYNSQGNYWDDYNDYDSNEDGIGDNPYIISGGGGNQDNFPLGDFLSLNQQPVAYIDSISPNPAIQGQTVNFNGHGADDGSILAWEWRSNGTIISNSGSFSKSDFSAGTYDISFRVQDNDAEWSDYDIATLVINSQNQKPIAYILEPITSIIKNYGNSIEFLGDWSDEGQAVEFNWRSDIDGVLSNAIQFTKSDLTVGQHVIYFKVRDDDGEWSSEVSIGVTILSGSSNNPPVADAGGPYSGYINISTIFDGSNSYDPDDGDSITSYQWNFGDGSTGEGVSVQYIYTSEGNYTIELTVVDSHGLQSKSTTYVNISIQVNGQSGNGGKDNGIPGFEIIFVLIGIAFIVFYKRKKRK